MHILSVFCGMGEKRRQMAGKGTASAAVEIEHQIVRERGERSGKIANVYY